MKNIVLVHGAWHGAWSWQRVIRPLQRDGHNVFAPSLTGLGDRSHLLTPDITLSTHVRDITNLIENEELEDIVLCGHSYAGLVVAQAADRMPSRIAAIVFLDAFLPENGKSLHDLLPEAARVESETDAKTRGGGWLAPTPDVGRLEVADRRDLAWLERRCGPQPLATFTEPSKLTGAWRKGPRLHYVAASEFSSPVFKGFARAAKADPAFTCHALACGHEIMLDKPDETCRILAAA
jgi:pimeloyl-ACP methyl ester carboxylesterase